MTLVQSDQVWLTVLFTRHDTTRAGQSWCPAMLLEVSCRALQRLSCRNSMAAAAAAAVCAAAAAAGSSSA